LNQLNIKEDYGKYDEDVFKEPHQVLMQECLLIEKNVGEVVDKSTKKLRKKKRGRRKLVYEVNLEKFFTYKWMNEYRLINSKWDKDSPIYWDEDDDGWLNHKMIDKLLPYRRESNRKLSFEEVRSHTLYETYGLLYKEQEELQEKFVNHKRVIEYKNFKQLFKEEGEEEEGGGLVGFKTNQYGYIVPMIKGQDNIGWGCEVRRSLAEEVNLVCKTIGIKRKSLIENFFKWFIKNFNENNCTEGERMEDKLKDYRVNEYGWITPMDWIQGNDKSKTITYQSKVDRNLARKVDAIRNLLGMSRRESIENYFRWFIEEYNSNGRPLVKFYEGGEDD